MTDWEKIVLEELRDLRADVADLRADVAALKAAQGPAPRGLAATGGLTVSAATLGGAVLWLLQHWVKP